MNLEELKKFLNSLPEGFNTFNVVNGEVGELPSEEGDNGDGLVYRCDKPIITLYVDEQTKEICFLHQTQEEVTDIAGDAYFGSDDLDGTTEEDTKV